MGSLGASPFISFLVTTQVTKVPSAPRAAKEARDAAKFWNLEGNMSSLLLRTSFFVRGRRQGRQPLNPATPRRRWWKLSIALATRGLAPAGDPPQKSFSLVGFSRFSGSGVDKKRVKFEDAFWRS